MNQVEAGSGHSESTYPEESEYLKGTETCPPEQDYFPLKVCPSKKRGSPGRL